jgi:hypothetical protein
MSQLGNVGFNKDAGGGWYPDVTAWTVSDGTASPNVVSISVTSAATAALNTPVNAVSVLLVTDQIIYLTPLVGAPTAPTAANAITLAAGASITLPVAGVSNIYMKAAGSTATVKFIYFTTAVI